MKMYILPVDPNKARPRTTSTIRTKLFQFYVVGNRYVYLSYIIKCVKIVFNKFCMVVKTSTDYDHSSINNDRNTYLYKSSCEIQVAIKTFELSINLFSFTLHM